MKHEFSLGAKLIKKKHGEKRKREEKTLPQKNAKFGFVCSMG